MGNKIGSIFIADETKDRMSMALQVGRVISRSNASFSFDQNTEVPDAGDIVLLARYAGAEFIGCDGKKYRMAQDKDVMAVFIDPNSEVKQSVVVDLHQMKDAHHG